MKRLVALLLAGATVTASGCATVPLASTEADLAAKKFDVPPGQANLYVYRNESFGGAIRMSVLLDGMALGDTAAMTYLYTPIAPGKHTVVSKAENDSELIFEAKPGVNHFFWQEVKMGLWHARSALQEMDDAKGRAGVAECKLAKTNPPLAPPGCSKDTDCKGDRICRDGVCVEPAAKVPIN
jgi:hypothetical protein